MIDSKVLEFMESLKVARLATVDADNRPNVVPICFACGEKGIIYSAIDSKPKSVASRIFPCRELTCLPIKSLESNI